jgi:hypothetical protein
MTRLEQRGARDKGLLGVTLRYSYEGGRVIIALRRKQVVPMRGPRRQASGSIRDLHQLGCV